MISDSDSAHWKQKYFDSLEELEARESEWKSSETLLRQIASRLTLAADPAEKALVKLLDSLRDDLRRDAPPKRLEAHYKKINAAILSLDEERQRVKAIPDIATGLSRVLDKLELPQGIRRKGKALQKELASPSGQDNPDPLIGKFIALIQESFNWLSEETNDSPAVEEKDSSQSGIFKKLFQQREEGQAASGNLTEITRLLADNINRIQVPEALQSSRDNLVRQCRAINDLDGLERWFNDLKKWIDDLQENTGSLPPNEALLQLLERLDLPGELFNEAERLKQRLQGDQTPESIARSLIDLADLIARARAQVQKEKNEIEAFLADLTTRLTQIDDSIEQSEQSRSEAVAQRKTFDQQMQQEVDGMHDSVQSAQDLNALKQVISTRIDTIQKHMENHRQMEQQRDNRAQEEIRQLSAQLETFQSEATMLHDKLEEAREQAIRDALTGLPNRMAYEQRIDEEISRSRRYQRPLSLAVMDIDFFKKINDQFGHPAGDNVLKVLAELFQRRTRDSDFVARLGGEEFMMILPETSGADAFTVTDKLREVVEQANFHYRETAVPVTVSCGITELAEGDDPASLYKRADEALYKAKHEGRNQCQLKPPEY